MASSPALKKMRIKLVSKLDEQVMLHLYAAPLSYSTQVKASIDNFELSVLNDNSLTFDEKGDIKQDLDAEVYALRAAVTIANEAVILGLFKTIEISMLKVAKASELFNRKDLNGFSKTSHIRQALRRKGIILSNIRNFCKFEELKELNNCLKHSGIASNKLTQFNPVDYQARQPIVGTRAHFTRLLFNCLDFVSAFGDEVATKIR
jgi:hypothetical protein